MSPYRAVPRKAIRYTEQTRITFVKPAKTAAKPEEDLSALSYRDLQQRAILLGINGRQTREELEAAIKEAEA